MNSFAFISDFDGTITKKDFYLLIAERYMPADSPDYLAEYRAGRLTHFDAMQLYFNHAPTASGQLEELLRDTQPDARLAECAKRLEAAGWDLIIVSAGSSWYIDRILGNAGVRATVHSNPGRIEESRGFVMERPVESPFFSREVGIDKASVVRDALSRYKRVAFAGDGPPDVMASLLVAPSLRFARAYLAETLDSRGESFRAYRRWSDIADALLAGA